MGSIHNVLGSLRRHGRSPWVAGPAVAFVALPSLYAAALLGVAWRSSGGFGPLPGHGGLDYGRRLPAAFVPLREGFVASVLGDVIQLPGGPRGVRTAVTGSRETRSAVAQHPRSDRIVDVHPLTNDDIAEARLVTAIPYSARTDTRGATRQVSDPADCGSVGGTVWYRYRATVDGVLAAYTFGSDHSVTLGVFSRTGERLSPVAPCDTDNDGSAFVHFRAQADVTYYFQITAPVDGGRLQFSLDHHGTFVHATRGLDGGSADGDVQGWSTMSADGRYVAFTTWATNLTDDSAPVPCTSDILAQPLWRTCNQVFVRDTATNTTTMISKSKAGVPGNAASGLPFISADGRFVVFESVASNLGGNGNSRMYVYDRTTGRLDAIPAKTGLSVPSITDDGRYVAFQSVASNLVDGDTNESVDVFVYDRWRRRYERVNLDDRGRPSPSSPQVWAEPYGGYVGVTAPLFGVPVLNVYISGDGRYVTFRSDVALVPHDRNLHWDTYLRDRLTGTTELISVAVDGDAGNGSSFVQPALPAISNDGRYVVFASAASNLVPDDTDKAVDVFVRDRRRGATMLVSSGFVAPGYQTHVPAWPSISGDGRFVNFESNALAADGYLLVRDAAYETADVYRYDLATGTTSVVTQSLRGEDGWGLYSSVSRDGRSVVFMSGSANFGPTSCSPGDHRAGRCWNVFVYRVPGQG